MPGQHIRFQPDTFQKVRSAYEDKDLKIDQQDKRIDHLLHVIAGLKGENTKLRKEIWKQRHK